ncbi:GumC family protein [Paraglaciecola marina]|uniref:GumC family protein n=1 Tax=Paraglaciecola marina TaxID=2500157 RepID=UPI0010617436|nr:polysaccharide biosynthesis tyrosine autokinase [Paraglaciecola marina]
MNEVSVSSQDDIIDFGQYWRTMYRAKWLILLSVIVFVAIGFYLTTKITPTYESTAKILVDPQKPSVSFDDERIVSNAMVVLFYQTQYEILSSRQLAEEVIDRLGLIQKFKAQKSQNNEAKSFLKTLFGTSDVELSDAELKILIANNIRDTLSVSGDRQSQVIQITFESTDAKEAADIVNTLSEVYIEFGLESRMKEVKNSEGWLNQQSSQLKTSLDGSIAKLNAYKLEQGLVDTQQQQSLANSQLQSLNNELIRAQTRLSSAHEQYLYVQNLEVNDKDLYSLGPVLQNSTAVDMVKEQARLSQRVNELSERYGDKHPQMIAARSELQSATENLAVEVSKVVENIEKEYKLALLQVSNIEKLIAESREHIQALQSKGFSLLSLEREVENNRRTYENFQLSILESNGVSDYSVSNVQVIDKATPALTPASPNVKLILVAFFMFGLFLSIGIALLREAMDNTFKTSDSVKESLSIPSLGITPLVKSSARGNEPEKQYFKDVRSGFAESINTIRTGLLFSNIDNPPKTLLVTSSLPSEGKSTLAINLAAAYSHIGKTLLLEVDLRKPSIAKSLAITSDYGLSNIVKSFDKEIDKGPDGGIVKVGEEGQLSVICAGTLVPNPLELLSSKKFEDVLSALGELYEYIILDGPPTLPVSDSCLLANKVDGVVFAVKSNDTKYKDAKEAILRLQKLHANVIGSVLTVADTNKMSAYGDEFHTGNYYGEVPKYG